MRDVVKWIENLNNNLNIEEHDYRLIMESHYENQGLVSAQASQSFKKPPGFIDFYRQSDGLLQVQTPFDRNLDDGDLMMNDGSGMLVMGRQEQPSPIYSSMKMDNYLLDQQHSQQQYQQLTNSKAGAKDEAKKTQLLSAADKQVALKRRSIENNRQHVRAELKPSAYQAKSALSNYPQQQQQQQNQIASLNLQQNAQLRQINKNGKVERDPIMDQQQHQPFKLASAVSSTTNQQAQLQQQQQQRNMAKSQSQNRLMLVSPDNMLSKNNPLILNPGSMAEGDNCIGDNRSSFMKDHQLVSSSRMSTHMHQQDPMYKQHLQYSSGPQGGHHSKAWQLKTNNQQNLILSRLSTNNCTFCNKTHGGMTTMLQPHQCSAIYCSKDQQGFMIQNNLSKKYSTNRDYYNLKIVNDLIYNENTHIVSIFKDYLILDDINEFLKRYYTQPETKVRLPKLCSFYDKYSQVFPNYVVLPESKYMFKNIQRKQKLIDEQYQLQEHLANKLHQTLNDEDKLFNSKFYNSYYSMANEKVDMSMTKKQYEDQAKQIAIYAGRKVPVDQMKIDELMDRFLMKDSESNIQLLTEGGLDFSGFTQQNSTFFNQQQNLFEKTLLAGGAAQNQPTVKVSTAAGNNKQVVQQLQQAKTHGKPMGGHSQQHQPVQVLSQQQQRASQQTGNYFKRPQANQAQNTNHGQGASSQSQKRQKISFSNTQAASKQGQQKGADNLKIATNTVTATHTAGGNSSSKNTPRLQGKHLDEQQHQQLKQHSSPATKEAIKSYLQGCQLAEGNSESPASTVGIKQKGLMPTASQSSLHSNQVLMNSNSLNNANRAGLKSQQTLLVQQNQITNLKKTTRLSNGGAGFSTKPKAAQPSAGSNNGFGPSKSTITQQQQMQHQQQLQMQQQQQQYGLSNSRNQQIGNNSTQKSSKSVNSHAKYLSGGNEQYQKLLAGINGGNATAANIIQASQQQQYTYLTNFDTINGQAANSSTKKSTLLAQQRSKGELDTYLISGVGAQTQQSNAKDLYSAHGFLGTNSDQLQQDIVTGEDCDDFGIADERFASPEAKLVFSTIDDAAAAYQAGRKSLEGAMLLSSSEDKLLSQCNNFDQIKRHLEQYITSNQQTTFDSVANTSGKKQQYLSHGGSAYNQQHLNTGMQMNTLLSGGGPIGVSDSGDFSKTNNNMVVGYSRDHHLTSSTQGNMHNPNNTGGPVDSRNSQKHFESLKQKIRGVFDNNNNVVAGASGNTEGTQQSASKTPLKSSSHSKKSTITVNTNTGLPQNRMSIESKSGPGMGMGGGDNIMMMVSSNGQGVQSTQAHRGGQLQFAQSSFSSANNGTGTGVNSSAGVTNYRSITNIQQRKGSKPQLESSLENKRLSSGTNTQIRQSFRDGQQVVTSSTTSHLQPVNHGSSTQDHKIKRSVTGKTLTINDINSQTFGGVGGVSSNFSQQQQHQHQQLYNSVNPNHHNQQMTSTSSTITNPTFISSNGSMAGASASQKISNLATIQNPSFNQQQAQQAANTVRVMTPSYSLASLSKIISPTQQASPLTMTVSLSNTANQNRKQVGVNSSTNKSTKQQYSTNSGIGATSGTYLLNDKQGKVVKHNAHKAVTNGNSKMASPAYTSSSSSTLNIQTTLAQQSHQAKLSSGRQGNSSNGLGSPQPQHTLLAQSNSLQVFQVTPRGVLGASVHQQQQEMQRVNRGGAATAGGTNPILENSQNLSCTVSTENNTSNAAHPLINIAAKAIESKNPKFMRTIEETGSQQPSYNTMLSASLGHRKSGAGLTMSVSQAQFELQKKAQSKVQTVVSGTAQSQTIKRASGSGAMAHSLSVQQFKSPQQSVGLQSKKHNATASRYPNM